ncbi:MAG: aldo/keto reductase [Actinomycetota bacterium]|nr:aldo/keto reductase [Actinomycetota bacterium]
MAEQPQTPLNGATSMPQLGFGVFQVPNDQATAVVAAAFQVGYRHVDTAAMYRNEEGVGRAISDSGLAREDLFITTKLNNNAHGYDEALRAFEESRGRLGLDYVDLYLIHWPLPAQNRYVETWRAFEQLHRDGLARAIGVSNFQPAHLRRIIDETGTVPAVNQIELHPYLVQEELRTFHAEHGIATEAWSPLARGGHLITDPAVTAVADAHHRSPAQVVIRWHLQLGNIVIPKSVTPSRIAENFDVFDFELAPAEVDAISGLDRNERTGPDPDHFNP